MTHSPYFSRCDECEHREQSVSQNGQLKENTGNPEQGSVQFVFAFKKKHITELLGLVLFFTPVICDPFACAAKSIWLFFSGKPVGGCVWGKPRLSKIPADAGAEGEESPQPHKQRRTPPPPPPAPEEKTADILLTEGLSQSQGGKSPGKLPVGRPSGLCLSEDAPALEEVVALCLKPSLPGLLPDASENTSQPFTIWVALDEFLKLPKHVFSSVIELVVPTSSDVLELSKTMCIHNK